MLYAVSAHYFVTKINTEIDETRHHFWGMGLCPNLKKVRPQLALGGGQIRIHEVEWLMSSHDAVLG